MFASIPVFLLLCCLCMSHGWHGYNKVQPRRTVVMSMDRKAWVKVVSASLLVASLFSADGSVLAADKAGTPLIYKSGKNPVPPNPPDSKEGTKKDSSFLRAMSNCKSTCQKPGEGLAKLDCLQDCQDQCCNSYEQCSFKIKTSSSQM